MTRVVKSGDTVKRAPSTASDTIQRFMKHLRAAGIDWIPEPLGFDEHGNEVFRYIEGECVDGAPPSWFWEESLLVDIAQRLRQFHDASTSFATESAVWNWDAIAPAQVIIHRDFAPYNCIFRDESFVGLIDFDLCAPGPRVWDIAYTAYRFVPLMPVAAVDREEWTRSPFDVDHMRARLALFVDAYCGRDKNLVAANEVLQTATRRLDAMVDWIREWTQTHLNSRLAQNAINYAAHRDWLAAVAD